MIRRESDASWPLRSFSRWPSPYGDKRSSLGRSESHTYALRVHGAFVCFSSCRLVALAAERAWALRTAQSLSGQHGDTARPPGG